MLVVGIDPGTATTGYGVVISEAAAAPRRQTAAVPLRLVECGVIRTRPRDPMPSRLLEIAGGVRELIARHRPDLMAVEDAFYSRNAQTTLALGHARGVVLLAAAEAGVPVVEFPPAEIKKTVVGTGSASKEQVQYMLTQLLHLRSSPQPSDASDGVAAAVTAILTAHVRRLRAGAVTPVPARQAAGGGGKVIEFPAPDARGRRR